MDHVEFSRLGGKAGAGIKKVRGDSDYYSRLAKMRKKPKLAHARKSRWPKKGKT